MLLKQCFFVLITLSSKLLFAQTVVINEFSNGTAGNEEWVELLVVSNTPNSCIPQTIDLRGWILDDNNGDFGSDGIASGCNRFSMDVFWSAIPVGTLITIYNDADKHPYFTPATDDASMSDGNCKLTLPISSNLMDGNATLPTTGNANYPTIGWTAGGSWGYLSMSNSGDSFQVRDPAQIASIVFSISYGSGNMNNVLIYFPGGGGQTTFYAENTISCDWKNQSNWTSKNVSGNETPTQANSSDNSACLNVQSNNCSTGPGNFQISVSNDTTICFGGTAQLQAFGATSYSWNNGLGTGDQHAVSPGQSTWYVVTGTTGSCSDDDSIFVQVVTQNPIKLIADTIICSGQLVMSGNTNGTNQGTWSFSSTSGIASFQNVDDLNPIVQFSAKGDYRLYYTEALCGYKDSVEVRWVDKPNIAFDVEEYIICPSDLARFELSDSLNLTSATWGLPSPAQDTLFSANLMIGTHTVTVTNQYKCSNDLTFTINALTDPIIVNPSASVCAPTFNMTSNIGDNGGLWTQISGPAVAVFQDDTLINTALNFTEPGTYEFTYQLPDCPLLDTLFITIITKPDVAVNSLLGCLGQSFLVTAVSKYPNIESYVWSNNETSSATTISVAGDYNLIASNSCGSATAAFTVELKDCDVVVPNVFSPDGDGVNELFYPRLDFPEAVSTMTCQIFNRWGGKIMDFTNSDAGWDGMENGKMASDGTYFYLLNARLVNGKDVQKQGDFQLIRSK